MQELQTEKKEGLVNVNQQEPKTLPRPVKVEAKKPMPERDYSKVPKEKSVFLLWILSSITFGIYPAVWYIKRSKEFYNLGTKKTLSTYLSAIFLIARTIMLSLILVFPLTITPEMGSFLQNLSSLQTNLLILLAAISLTELILSIIISFISRGIINEALEKKEITRRISWFFTLVFGFLYLQYEINRIIKDREYQPRRGPWILFLLILLFIILGILSSFLKI